jgi:hypothetical protein
MSGQRLGGIRYGSAGALGMRPLGRVPALVVCVAVLVAWSPTMALAGGRLAWSAPRLIDPCPSVSLCAGVDATGLGTPVAAISCPSSSLCVAGDAFGNVITSTSPRGPASTWQFADVTSGPSCDSAGTCGAGIASVSCRSASLCVAGESGLPEVASSTQPAGGASRWSQSAVFSFGSPGPDQASMEDSGIATGVSCPSPSLCTVAYEEDSYYPDSDTGGQGTSGVTKSTNPAGAFPGWSDGIRDRGQNLVTGLSCASVSVCVAVDNAGNVLNALPAGDWQLEHVDGRNALNAIACPSASLCVAVDGSGNVVSSKDPGAHHPAWHTRRVDAHHAFTAISCPSASLCVAVDGKGNVVTSTNPAGGAKAWHITRKVDPGLTAVSCPSKSLCVAVDGAGRVVIGTAARGRNAGGHRAGT